MDRVDRRPAAAPRDHRQGEADPRLPRGRPRARLAPDEHDVSPVQKATIIARGDALGYTLQPARRGALPRHQGGARRLDGRHARRPRRRAGHLRPRHDRRRERPREGHLARPLDGLRVRDGRERRLAHDARRQLRALRGDQAACATWSRRSSPTTPTPRRSGSSRSTAPLLDRVAAALLEKETLSREELLELFGDVEPESRASETVGVVPSALDAGPARPTRQPLAALELARCRPRSCGALERDRLVPLVERDRALACLRALDLERVRRRRSSRRRACRRPSSVSGRRSRAAR